MFYSSQRRRVPSNTIGPSLTQQSDKDECDIHSIVNRAKKKGELPIVGQPVYGDGSVPDYHQAQAVIASANQQFALLPSDVRDQFHNDPIRFFAQVTDPRNRDQLISMGISVAHLPLPPAPVVPPIVAEGGGVKPAVPPVAPAGQPAPAPAPQGTKTSP